MTDEEDWGGTRVDEDERSQESQSAADGTWGSPDGGAAESDSEPVEGEGGQSPSGESGADGGAGEPAQHEAEGYGGPPLKRRSAQAWREGTVDTAMRPGGYAFLPVFGFNEGHVAVRRFTQRYDMDMEDWWEEDGTEGKMFDDDDVEEEPMYLDGKELSWWEDESIMPKHPFMLINPVGFTTADADRRDFRDLFRLQKGEQFVFSDSGGYQLMSMGDEAEIVDSVAEHEFQDLSVYPERLVEWQVTNADAGATIDFPPYNISGDANFPDAASYGEDWLEFWQMRKEKSRDMVNRMASYLDELRDHGYEGARDYIFSPVIHGKPNPGGKLHGLVEEWHKSMAAAAMNAGLHHQPRGWVLKPEPSHSFGQIALHLGYAAEALQDADYIHVLMVGGLLQKTLLMYYASRTDQFVTSDASSYAAGGKRRQFDLPKTARRRSVIITNRTDEEREDSTLDASRLDRYPCRCPVCSTVERERGYEWVTTGTGSARNATLNLHNLHQALSIERTLDALIREEEFSVETGGQPTGDEFWRFVSTITSDVKVQYLYDAMDYVRLCLEEGQEEAQREYSIDWQDGIGAPTNSAGRGWE